MNNEMNDDRNDNINRDRNVTGSNAGQHNLQELSGSDYKIAEDQPDIDGWEILDQSRRKVGKVKDLLFDESARKVRYIVTNLKKGDLIDLDDDRYILIPIGQAQLDTDDDKVIVPNINLTTLSSLPHYEKAEDLTRDDEARFRNFFAGTTGEYNREKFYEHEHFDEDRFYAKKERMDTGTFEKGERSRIVDRPVGERTNSGTRDRDNLAREQRNRDGDVAGRESIHDLDPDRDRNPDFDNDTRNRNV